MPQKIKKPFIADELLVASFGIFVILLLEAFAIYKGIDGTMFGASMAGIGVIIGWIFKTIYKRP